MDNSTINKKFHSFIRAQELTRKWKKTSNRKFVSKFDGYEIFISLAQPKNSSERLRIVTLLIEIVFPSQIEPDPMHRFDVVFKKDNLSLQLALTLKSGLEKLNHNSSFDFQSGEKFDEYLKEQAEAFSNILAPWIKKNDSLTKVLKWYQSKGTAFWVELFLYGIDSVKSDFLNFMANNKGYRVDDTLANWLYKNGIINKDSKKELYVASLQHESVLEGRVSEVLNKIAKMKTYKPLRCKKQLVFAS